MGKLNKRSRAVFPILTALLVITFFLSLKFGAITISWAEIQSSFLHWITGGESNLNERIFLQIRLPRAFAGVLVGAGLFTNHSEGDSGSSPERHANGE